jgi:5-methylcytosine-specific restriction endonuclease McrA
VQEDDHKTQTIVSRKEALALGLPRYFTGKPCHLGHLSARQVSSCGCVECHKLSLARHKAKDPEGFKTRRRGYYAADPERAAEWTRAYRAKNLEKRRATFKAWAQANKEVVAAHSRNRRARMSAAEGSHTAAEIKALFEKQKGRCAICRVSVASGYHADHIQPLHLGGSNYIQNIQILCPTCNNRKWAKDPDRFARELGRLL